MNTLYKSPYFIHSEEEEENEPETKPGAGEEQKSPLLLKKQEELFLEKRAVYLWGIVDDKSARELVSKFLLLEADKPGEEIKFYINSPGGVVTSGMVIYDTIEMISSPVSTICMGMAASMGSILLSVGTKGRRFIFPHGEVMIHQPSIGGYFQATSADIEIQAEQIEKTKIMGAQLLAKNCDKSVEQVLKDFDRDFYMDAEQAVNYGIVDAVLEKL
ncbi:MAG TPA: ATP-dependent Clp protease proteolytic subunit [Arachidicoccus sp.]|nr:ATP-dependent Clp protease proteolytic subunit [Arachidicoccus sp.]